MGWEAFEVYNPAPIERCPARYATPPLDISIHMGTTVIIQPPFVSLSGSKVGVDPSSSFTARAVCLLLGGTWNSTNQRMDKRRWVLVEHGGDFYLAPLDVRSVSAGKASELAPTTLSENQCKSYAEKLIRERTTGSVNNLYQTARNAVARALAGRGSAGGSDG
eukprot:5275123-Pleurochrysis_carterae.AAC.1